MFLSLIHISYYNAYFSAYEYPTAEDPSHDVILVGWDDTVSRFLFRDVPEEDGAWVCQNSWGGSFGNDGLFYVSYACLLYTSRCV